jgi:hypothetical protein
MIGAVRNAAIKQSQRGGTCELQDRWYQPGSRAERNRVRRMPGAGRMVVSSASMRAMRAHRLLRYVAQSACIEAQCRDRAPDHHEFRAGRAVVLRLSDRAILRRPEASGASRAPAGSTGARTGRGGAVKLANAAERIGAVFCFGRAPRSQIAAAQRPTARPGVKG